MEDELSIFARLMREKFLEGRKKYETEGHPVYDADTIHELQGELIDNANYSAVLYFELERWREGLGYTPEVRNQELGENQVLVKLEYYRLNGKWVSDAEFVLDITGDAIPWFAAIQAVEKMRDEGKLPGLIGGTGLDFHILVMPQEDPVSVLPHLLLSPVKDLEGGE